jgi:hypothetical protein
MSLEDGERTNFLERMMPMKLFVPKPAIGGLLLALCLIAVWPAHASRMLLPMGHYIRDAGLIVIADTRKGTTYDETVLFVREVLKGDATQTGRTITLRRGGIFSTADARIPTGTTNVAVLLSSGWQDTNRWPVLEAYHMPDDLVALRVLTKICAVENERERLVALHQTLSLNNQACVREIFAQLRDMREAKNFDLVTNLYSNPELTNKIELVRLIGHIGDLRGVPILLVAAASSDKRLSRTAVDSLRWDYPGAPGVMEMMRKALDQEHLAHVAAQYLVRYDPEPKLSAAVESRSTPWLRASRLLEEGKRDEGRAALMSVVEGENENIRTRLLAASRLVAEATPTEKSRLRKSLLPLLIDYKYANDYMLGLQAVEILRELRHPDCLPALLPLLEPTQFTFAKTAWTTTMALRELGEEARQKAVAQILAHLKSAPPQTALGRNPLRYSLELVWLGSQQDCENAERIMHPEYTASWKSLRPLRGLGDTKDLPSFLIQLSPLDASLPVEAREWLLLSKSKSNDRRAITQLITSLVENPDWSLSGKTADALVTVGGADAEAELLKLMNHPDENRVRRHASEALFRILGARSHPVALRVLTEKEYGWRPAAYQTIGKIGTTNDLNQLQALADFWNGDRGNHYWAMSALNQVRDRCRYDVNGPIQPIR